MKKTNPLNLQSFHLRIIRNKTEKEIFQKIWTDAWLGEHYADKDNLAEIVNHHDHFKEVSEDLLLRNLDECIGSVRLVWDNEKIGIPVLNDFETTMIWHGKVAEITLFAISNKWRDRNAEIGLLMFQKATTYAKQKGAIGIVVAADKRVFRLMKYLGLKPTEIGQGKEYEGSFTIPAYYPLA